MKSKLTLVTLFLILIVGSNWITYKLAFYSGKMDYFFNQVQIDALTLKELDKNDTETAETILQLTINSFLLEVGRTNEIDQYQSMCKVFDKELFQMIDMPGGKENEIKIDGEYGKQMTENKKIMEQGRLKMKKLCHVSN